MDKNDIIEYVMNTPHNTNKAVLSSMLNQLTEGGGGGSSDFSTATVAVNVNGNGTGTIIYPTIGDTVYLDHETDDPIAVSDVAYYGKASVSVTGPINILTYKGKTVIYTNGISDIENGIASQRLYDEVLDQSCFALSNVSNATIITIEPRGE